MKRNGFTYINGPAAFFLACDECRNNNNPKCLDVVDKALAIAEANGFSQSEKIRGYMAGKKLYQHVVEKYIEELFTFISADEFFRKCVGADLQVIGRLI